MKTTDLSAQHMARQTALLDFDSRRNYSQIIFTLTQHLKDKDDALKAQEISLIDYKHKAGYWEAQFNRLKTRALEKDEIIEALKAKLKKRDHQLFGRKSEKGTTQSESQKSSLTVRRRGQQSTHSGPIRRDYSDLPTLPLL